MLSSQEQGILDEIEKRLAVEAPRLADLLTRRMQDRWRKTEARAYDVMVAYALVSAVLCFTVSEMAAGLVAALFTYVVFALRGARYPPYRERWSALGRCRERARE